MSGSEVLLRLTPSYRYGPIDLSQCLRTVAPDRGGLVYFLKTQLGVRVPVHGHGRADESAVRGRLERFVTDTGN